MARVTVEDCLEKIPNRFALVSVASKRAREIMAGSEPKVRCKNREQVTALREIAKGFIVPDQNVADMEEQTVESIIEDSNY